MVAETETEPSKEPESHENMTVVILGETAVWMTVWEYYANFNR